MFYKEPPKQHRRPRSKPNQQNYTPQPIFGFGRPQQPNHQHRKQPDYHQTNRPNQQTHAQRIGQRPQNQPVNPNGFDINNLNGYVTKISKGLQGLQMGINLLRYMK